MTSPKSILMFESFQGLRCRPNEPMKSHLPLRVGGKCLAWIRVHDLDELKQALKVARQLKLSWKVHWPFEDWIVKDHGFNGIIIRLCGAFERIEQTEDDIDIGAAALWSELNQHATWLNEMSNWPGSVGAVFSNGQGHCLKGYHLELELLKGTRVIRRIYTNKDSIVDVEKGAIPIKLRIRGRRLRKRNGPMKAGLIFEETGDAVIERAISSAAANGVRLRDWRISTQNNGRVTNLNKGNCKDLLLLAKGLQDRIKKISGKRPEIRIPIIGSHKKVQ